MSQETRTQPANAEAARAEIQRTRARMSETIDKIEDVLLQTRERLQQKLDVRSRIREKPVRAVGIVLGVSIVLGFLAGGKKGADVVETDSSEPRARERRATERAALWEGRARRLLAIARDQEREIEDLENVLEEQELELEDWREDRAVPTEPPAEKPEEGWTHRVADFVADASRSFIERLHSRE